MAALANSFRKEALGWILRFKTTMQTCLEYIQPSILLCSEVSIIKRVVHRMYLGLMVCGLLIMIPAKVVVGETWIPKADLLNEREHLSTCVLDGAIYAIGGLGENNTVCIGREATLRRKTLRSRLRLKSVQIPTMQG